MATTADAIQAQLDPTGLAAKILSFNNAGTKQNIYVRGGVGYAGRCLWVETTASDTAAQQATTITNAMRLYSA